MARRLPSADHANSAALSLSAPTSGVAAGNVVVDRSAMNSARSRLSEGAVVGPIHATCLPSGAIATCVYCRTDRWAKAVLAEPSTVREAHANSRGMVGGFVTSWL